MDCIIEAISHRRRALFGKKRLILGRSTSVHLPRLHRFFREHGAALDCDRFSDSFLDKAGIKYKRQLHSSLSFSGTKIGSYFFDFLIEGIIVPELKQGERFSKRNMDQVLTYLKVHNLKLGIIAQFAQHDLKFKRIINLR